MGDSLLHRRTIGPSWRHDHLRWMIRSYAFVVVASINQVVLQTGLPNPPWLFWVFVLAPFLILPPYVSRLRARFPAAGSASPGSLHSPAP